MTTPKVLLLGNGLNRAYEGLNWLEGIDAISNNSKVGINSNLFSAVPYPLKAIVATQDRIDESLQSEKAEKLLFGVEHIDSIREPILELVGEGFDHILTTNYSYEIERALDNNFTWKGTHKHKKINEFNKTTIDGLSPERAYLIHTYNEVTINEKTYRIWHIHGDVYVLGFGFDYSEFDLWWLLNEKKYKGYGHVLFYEPSEDEYAKHALLKALGVQTDDLGFDTKPINYKDFYKAAIKEIRSKIL